MSLNSKNNYKLSVKRARTRRRHRRAYPSSLWTGSRARTARRNLKHMEAKSKLSGKLQALKKLIPGQSGETIKADRLFQETADYIVLLRTRVVILQKLIEYYGKVSDNENAVS
ncbi:hypothetical protein QN277_020548 [Acacia crassicarpa]|uniref:Uncharacterized protein n=1 Tax=Acacia crassicarpa TaxID=499986 RepID=A0AAE1MNE5_9FABA|nr:hypothetical protein QN277_020548 [Acacia crassicarpa]